MSKRTLYKVIDTTYWGEPVKLEDITSYGDFKPDPAGEWLNLEIASGGDYANTCMVHRCNYDEILKQQFCIALEELHVVKDVTGGYGTFAIFYNVVKLQELIDSKFVPALLFQEMLEALDDYPIFDDNAHSEYEIEQQAIAWDGWTARDFWSELKDKFAEIDDENGKSIDLEEMFQLDYAEIPDRLWSIFHDTMDTVNVYWEDSNGDAHIDLKRIVDYITLEMLTEALKPTEIETPKTNGFIVEPWVTIEVEGQSFRAMKQEYGSGYVMHPADRSKTVIPVDRIKTWEKSVLIKLNVNEE